MLQFFQGANLQQADIKYSTYDFYYRLKKIEKICIKDGVDGLLIITGIDGRESSENTKIINWVLLGHSGVEVESNEFLDANLSDLVLLIKPSGVSLYCDRQCWDAVKSKFIALPNVEVFVPNEDEDDNKDESELLKISQFLKMMTNIKKVGVLLGAKEKGKLSNIEKWPLIQSYGIEQLGRGFFSMFHQVVDLTARINSLYKVHDKHSLKWLINVIAKRLQGHTTAAVGQIVDVKMSKRPQITEEQLSEVFQDTFEIEEMNKFIKLRSSQLNMPSKPRVLIGTNTNLAYDQFSSSKSIQQLGLLEDKPALHLTVETFDLLSSLRCARTYFLSRQVSSQYLIHQSLNEEGFIESYSFEKQEQTQYKDEKLLMLVYKSLVISFQEIMVNVAKDYKNLTEQFIFDLIKEKLNQIPQISQIQHAKNLSILIGAYNAQGEEVAINFKDSVSFKLTPNFFLLRLQYSNIPSQSNKVLGSVLFAESFILQENCYFLVTSLVPYVNTFNVHGASQSDIIENLKKRLVVPELGKQLSEPCEKNSLFIPTNRLTIHRIDIPFYQSTYVLHENGLRIFCDNLGWFIVLFDTMDNIEIITGVQFEHTWMLCTLTVAFESLNLQRIALKFVGQAVSTILFPLKKILEEQGKQISNHQNIPQEFKTSHIAQSIIKQSTTPQDLNGNEVMNSSFLLDYLESKQLTILNQMKDLKLVNFKLIHDQQQLVPQDVRTGLILITGGISTGKRRFANNLARYAVDNKCQASVLEFGLLEQAAINENGFLQKLRTTIQEGQRSQNTTQKICICVVPFFLNLDECLNQIEGPKLSSLVYIRCVVNKINSNYFYVGEHSQICSSIVPLSQPGYCQILILDTFGNYESDVDDQSKLLRHILPDQQIYRITNNVLQASVAQTIYKENTYNQGLNTFLRTKLATLRLIPKNQIERLFIPYRVPMSKDKTRRILRQTLTPKPLDLVFEKNLSQDEKDLQRLIEKVKLMGQEQQFTLPKLEYVKGFLRYETELKEGIIEITGNVNYVTERPVKNVQVQLKDILVNGNQLQDADYLGWNREEDMGFLFCGHNLSREYCNSVLVQLGKGKPVLRNQLTIDALSQEIKTKIEFENRGQRLDHGYFYDGRLFRDEDGLIIPNHPRLSEFIQEYLDKENLIIQQENTKTISEWDSYLKAYK